MVICMRNQETEELPSAYSDQFDMDRRDHYMRFPLVLNFDHKLILTCVSFPHLSYLLAGGAQTHEDH